MTIRDYIQEQVFSRRARERGTLVVYDPARRYRELALALASDRCRVIDASLSVIEQREAAEEALAALAEGKIDQFVVWVPAPRPSDSDAKQRDPFAVFAEVGAAFPQGDGDDYASLCRRAKPDHIPEVNRLFAEGEPSFEVIDALDQGGSWPRLKTLLHASSPKEILLGLLSPKPEQDQALKADATWAPEAREFLRRSLGYRLKTKGQTRPSIAEELWRVLLFSEFVFDSGEQVPPELETVPRVGAEARGLVYEVCDDLRKHQDYKDAYRQNAEETERDLCLADRCQGMRHLGDRDTFAFEERVYLRHLVETARGGDLDGAQRIGESRRRSIWLNHEGRLAEWSLAGRALSLLDAAGRLAAPRFPTLESVVHGYASTWRELDRHHREMEQAVAQWQGEHDALESLVALARDAYFRSVEALQAEFVRLVAAEGWPPSGGQLLWSSQVFAKTVAPALEAGERVAYFLIDSLRYELGVEVEKQLSDRAQVALHTVCAQLPTYTEVGMASLMPEAESSLRLALKDGALVSTLGGAVVATPAQRFAYLRSRKGDQCGDIELDELLRQKKLKVPESVKLLVVRSRDIDSIAHGSPHQVHQVIPELVRQILRGVMKVADLGFDQAIIATDHGFLLFSEQGAGNVAPRPPGTWLVEKARCALGKGAADAANLVLKAGEVGIRGDFEHYAAPRALVPYSRGEIYYHEGLSLQECVLPCLVVRLERGGKPARKSPARLTFTYRQGKTDRITSRRPVVDLSWPQTGLFADENEIEVGVEAVDAKGRVVGWVGSSQSVNPATGGVRIRPGAALAVVLRMDDDFAGAFTVKVLDSSNNTLLASLPLKTDYVA